MKKTRGKTIFRKVRRYFWSKKASIREKKKSESERETERQRDLHPNVTIISPESLTTSTKSKKTKKEKKEEKTERKTKKRRRRTTTSHFLWLLRRASLLKEEIKSPGGVVGREREREKGKDAGQSYRACVPVSFPRALSFFFFFNASL